MRHGNKPGEKLIDSIYEITQALQRLQTTLLNIHMELNELKEKKNLKEIRRMVSPKMKNINIDKLQNET